MRETYEGQKHIEANLTEVFGPHLKLVQLWQVYTGPVYESRSNRRPLPHNKFVYAPLDQNFDNELASNFVKHYQKQIPEINIRFDVPNRTIIIDHYL